MQNSKLQKFISKNSFYLIECPNDQKTNVEIYINRVEAFTLTLKDIFGLNPSYQPLRVIFNHEGPHYEMGGTIKIPASLNLNEEENIYGGLFHETVHGFLEKYIHRPGGSNYFPESCAIILQVVALNTINNEWSNKFASGFGSSQDNHPVLFELVRIYREKGFDPIREIYSSMINSENPILYEQSFVDDLNKILKKHNVSVMI